VEWYAAIHDEQQGPFTLEQLEGYWQKGELNGDSLVWRTGMADWVTIKEVKDLRYLMDLVPQKRAPGPEAGGALRLPAAEDDSEEAWRPRGMTGMYRAATAAEASAARAGGMSLVPAPPEEEPKWAPGAASALASLVNDELSALSAQKAPRPSAQADSEGTFRPPPAEDDSIEAPLGSAATASAPPGGFALPHVPVLGTFGVPAVLSAPPSATLAGGPGLRTHKLMLAAMWSGVLGFMGMSALVVMLALGIGPFRLEGAALEALEVRRPTGGGLAKSSTSVPPSGGTLVAAAPGNVLGAEATPAAAPAPTVGASASGPEVALVPKGGVDNATKPTGESSSSGEGPTPDPAAARKEDESSKKAPVKESRAEPKREKSPRGVAKDERKEEPKPKSFASAADGTSTASARVSDEKPKEADKSKRKASADCDPILYPEGCEEKPKTAQKSQGRATLSKADILSVVKANKADINRCVGEQRKKDPAKAEGVLKMTWVIRNDGRTTSVAAESSEQAEDYVGKCMVRAIQGWKFESYTAEELKPIKFPFKLDQF
jgi:hypothetical protein